MVTYVLCEVFRLVAGLKIILSRMCIKIHEAQNKLASECPIQVRVGYVTINNNRAGQSAGRVLVTRTNVGSFTLNSPSVVTKQSRFPS